MRHLLISLSILLLTTPTFAELRPVDAPPGSGSLAPRLAALDDGRAVLTWLEPENDGHAFRFAVFDGEGFGDARSIAQGKDWFANWADTPGLFVLPNGDWLAHWLVKSGPATFAYDVVMARSDDGGQSWSEPKVPHRDGTQTEHGFVSYFAWDDETAGLVWLDGRETAMDAESENSHGGHHGHAGDMGLRTARVGPGTGVSDKQLLDSRVCDCCQTASAMTANGPLVIYRGRSEDEIRDIWKVHHDGEGWSDPELLHADGWQIGGCPVNGPDLIASGRDVVAAWFTMPDNEPKVRIVVSRDAGREFSDPIELGVGRALGRVALEWMGDGFVVAWLDQGETGSTLMLNGFDLDGGDRFGRELLAVDAGRISGFPVLTRVADDQLLLAWTEPGEDRRPRVRLGVVELAH
jgi:hypothetical protein